MRIDLSITVETTERELFAGRNAVVIDVLRATSVMTTAIANGATGFYPYLTPEKAEAAAHAMGGALLGGERGGVLIPGFDLANSPLEYTREAIGGRRICMTTSNGTRAVYCAKDAKREYMGSLLNGGAVADKLAEDSKTDVYILCAGSKGKPSYDDLLAGGMIVSKLLERVRGVSVSDSGWMALAAYEKHAENLFAGLMLSGHANRLVSLGFGEDIRYCASGDLLSAVPVFDAAENVIRAAD